MVRLLLKFLNEADLVSSKPSIDLADADLNVANLNGADLNEANFKQVLNLTVNQVKSAKNWELAIYEPNFRKQLGLPPETPVSAGNNNRNP